MTVSAAKSDDPGLGAEPSAGPAAAPERGAGSGAHSLVWEPGGPYSLVRTVGSLQCGAHDPAFIHHLGGIWLAFRNDDGAATVRLEQRGALNDARVHATAWGPGASAAIESVPVLLGADDDWSHFDTPGFQASLPELARKGRYLSPGLRLPSTGRMLDAVARVILEQKVTGIEAKRAWRWLLVRHGDEAPRPQGAPAGLRLPPTAAQWRRVPSWDWHRAGVDAHRSETILKAASLASGLERLAAIQSASQVTAALCSVSGIGPWTAAEVLQRTHGCPDSISVGDYHLAAYVGAALTGRRTDDAGMLELLAPWSGNRQRVVRMLYSSGFRKPTYGPRLAPEDHRQR
ncbi:DNA-3-methyladenine glycosylase [Arthrobacter sp. CAN_C5]|uniref:DNA-3-methyladenine glycosylase family protein n=1 Tax=Arthrobacter sp. CAN_C5 TaxID=2760706 RepID=UPI001FD9CED1|nr:3-methyladenine DNA glycosylase [Arthrobacter sp. CAN_C5]MBP2215619.1 3-methyladenine DNA glycosylase/8-oxoguanine DNA glycosylase [Arthrobacter sp. CAN_C5]